MIKYWSFTIFLCALLLSQGHSKKGKKAAYFLQSPSFAGDLPDEDEDYQDPTLAEDNEGSRKVLHGRYSAIIERGNPQHAVPFPDLDGRGQTAKSAKVIELYRKNLYVTIASAVNLTRSEKADEFASRLDECRDTLKECDDKGDMEIRCGLECLAKGNEFLENLIDSIITLVDRFCLPINTVFDKIFELKGAKHPVLRKFMLFLQHFKDTKKTWSEVAAQGVASLPATLIDKLKTDMMPYRLFIQKLENELYSEQLLQPHINPEKMIANSLCNSVDDADVAEDLLDVIYRNPVLVEAVLGGLTTLNLVTKYLYGHFRVPFAASAEALRILTGSTCGLIEYAEKGRRPGCDQMGGFPIPGIPLPAIPGLPELRQECLQGSVLNEDNDDSKEETAAASSATAASSAAPPVKREAEAAFGMEVVRNGKDGVAAASGNGAPRKKRSLAVGKKF